MSVLMVAEKPMLAQSIANLLSNGRMQSRKGFNGSCSIHEYNGTFLGRNAHFKVTSTCGHVMGVDFPGKYNSWDRVDPAELFGCPIEKKEANPKLKMPAFLASEAKGCEYLVLWLDCDKEGENICFEVIDAVSPVMRLHPQNIYRAHFSAITEKDIKASMNNLGRPNENESLSVDARQELDLRIGCAFTRFQTKYFQGKYGDLDSTLISFGPCQTPTLGFCVDRHDQIQSFKPETYWVVLIKLNDKGKDLKPEWLRGRIFDKEVATLFLERVKKQKEARVVSVTSKEGSKPRPQALNTVELMRVASACLGIGPQQAMHIAEQLYTQGYISYPRTETTQYPENFDLRGTLQQQCGNKTWGDAVKNLLAVGINKPKKGVDVGDHPPITPMRDDNSGHLSGDHSRIYDYITQHFIGSLMDDCRFLTTTVKFEVGTEQFSFSGKQLLSLGFTEVMSWQAIGSDEAVPEFNANEMLEVTEVKLAEKQTGPPDHLTEAELITLMEKHGIGTDASIPVHINNICQRNYVTVGSGRKLIPTRLGIALVHGYLKIDPQLVLPTMRAAVEEQLNLIAKGKADFHLVTKHALGIFKLKFQYFVVNILMMDELFESTFTSLAESGKPFTRCGKCHRYMKLIESKPMRLHCVQCMDTYSLPQTRDGTFRPYDGEQKCPLDEFELVYFSSGGGGKNFLICPYCYAHPPFPGMKKGQGCNECPHPACPHSFVSWGIAGCSVCTLNGVLVLDPKSGPKWEIACNKCQAKAKIVESALKVKVLEETCQECSSKLISVEFKPEKSPLKDGESKHTACLFCDEAFVSVSKLGQLSVVRNQENNFHFGGGPHRGGGRGRGRGRGGSRGRGSRGRATSSRGRGGGGGGRGRPF